MSFPLIFVLSCYGSQITGQTLILQLLIKVSESLHFDKSNTHKYRNIQLLLYLSRKGQIMYDHFNSNERNSSRTCFKMAIEKNVHQKRVHHFLLFVVLNIVKVQLKRFFGKNIKKYKSLKHWKTKTKSIFFFKQVNVIVIQVYKQFLKIHSLKKMSIHCT